MLIRKVIDGGVATTALGNPDTDAETLISDITPYLTRPTGYDLALLSSEAGVETAELIAARLLWFEVTVGSPKMPTEIHIDLRAVAIKDAQGKVAVGTVPLGSGQFTANRVLSIVPMN